MQRNYPTTCAAEPASLPPASYRLPPPARRLRGWHLLGQGTGARDPFPLQQLVVFRRRFLDGSLLRHLPSGFTPNGRLTGPCTPRSRYSHRLTTARLK
ncbi:unnamed protein product [Urochloa humidicola]